MSLLGLARANPPGFEASLLAAAEVRPEAVALRTKSRGDWRIWTWRDLLREIDRFSTFLEGRGIGHGTAVALVGEIRPSILFSALAAAAIGAAIVPVAPEATAAEIGALLDRKPIGLAVIQGRRALAAWLQAAAPRPRPVVLVFDHVTPTGKTPEDGVIPLAAVLSVAPARGWDEQRGTAGRSSRPRRWTCWSMPGLAPEPAWPCPNCSGRRRVIGPRSGPIVGSRQPRPLPRRPPISGAAGGQRAPRHGGGCFWALPADASGSPG
jgi:hypothetical protein